MTIGRAGAAAVAVGAVCGAATSVVAVRLAVGDSGSSDGATAAAVEQAVAIWVVAGLVVVLGAVVAVMVSRRTEPWHQALVEYFAAAGVMVVVFVARSWDSESWSGLVFVSAVIVVGLAPFAAAGAGIGTWMRRRIERG